MKVQLIEKRVKITGDVYYYITVDGRMQSNTWTTNKDAAIASYYKMVDNCRIYPEDVYEVIKSEEV